MRNKKDFTENQLTKLYFMELYKLTNDPFLKDIFHWSFNSTCKKARARTHTRTHTHAHTHTHTHTPRYTLSLSPQYSSSVFIQLNSTYTNDKDLYNKLHVYIHNNIVFFVLKHISRTIGIKRQTLIIQFISDTILN
jgi:hypothetical protein